MATMPTGTVTYLMTDIEGSARLWESRPDSMAVALEIHDRLAEEAAAVHHGHLVKARGEGDSLFMVFERPEQAVAAATQFLVSLREQDWPQGIDLRVRAAIHTGESEVRGSDYYGPAVNRCARLRAIAGAGQILISHAAQQQLPADVTVRDLGTHRLKDLLRPERVAEVVHPELPVCEGALGSLNRVQHNLPVQLTTFVGRQEEVLRIRSMLQAARLVTLTGSGGCGKTRLALQVGAESCDDFQDGVWFIDLTRVGAGENCAALIAKTLHLADMPDSDATASVVDAFAERRALLILDNCEHVIDQAAELVAELLEHCPELVLLATSREAMRVPGEVRSRVPSLSVPPKGADIKAIQQSDAVRLFCDRASLRSVDFALSEKNAVSILELCRLLDGIPLAIEQAASHAALLSPQQMLTRFRHHLKDLATDDRGVVPRHRTINATIRWSYDFLTEKEKLLLQRCSIYAGGWTLETAEAVCSGDGIGRSEVASLLGALLSKSFIFETDSEFERRYRLLQTVKEFASEMLGAGTPVLAQRHALHFLEAALDLEGADSWGRAQEDHDNMLMAANWFLEHDPENCFEYLALLKNYLVRTGHLKDAKTLFQKALARGGTLSQRASALNVLGAVNFSLGEYRAAQAAYDESLDLCAQVGDRSQQAAVLHNLGLLSAATGDHVSARGLIRRASEHYEALGDNKGHGTTLMNLARSLIDLKEYEDASKVLTQAIRLLERSGSEGFAGTARTNLALSLYLLGSDDRAIDELHTALRTWHSHLDLRSVTVALVILSGLAARRGQAAAAMRLARDGTSIRDERGYSFSRLENSILESVFASQELNNQAPYATPEDPNEVIDHAIEVCSLIQSRP